MIDPHFTEPLKYGEVDVGRKSGQKWRVQKKMHESAGSTRSQVIEAENNPNFYHLEDRLSNRSHTHEKK